jgi:hypothetical protein
MLLHQFCKKKVDITKAKLLCKWWWSDWSQCPKRLEVAMSFTFCSLICFKTSSEALCSTTLTTCLQTEKSKIVSSIFSQQQWQMQVRSCPMNGQVIHKEDQSKKEKGGGLLRHSHWGYPSSH